MSEESVFYCEKHGTHPFVMTMVAEITGDKERHFCTKCLYAILKTKNIEAERIQ